MRPGPRSAAPRMEQPELDLGRARRATLQPLRLQLPHAGLCRFHLLTCATSQFTRLNYSPGSTSLKSGVLHLNDDPESSRDSSKNEATAGRIRCATSETEACRRWSRRHVSGGALRQFDCRTSRLPPTTAVGIYGKRKLKTLARARPPIVNTSRYP